jgi:polyvinyl alcohol dehydrogenase (cytochrome)
LRLTGSTIAAALLAVGTFVATDTLADNADWPSGGADQSNSRYQDKEKRINSNTVGSLQKKWELATTGDVVATPTVDGNYLYFPDSAGSLYKVEKNTGTLVWKKPISGYTGIPNDFARASPAVAGNLLILGNQAGKFFGPAAGQPNPGPAYVFAVDKDTGNLAWSTQVDSYFASFVTSSAIVAKGTAFVGVAGNEEVLAAFAPPPYTWVFRGSVVALDVKTGAIKWKTYTVPPGYYGAGVWGGTGAIHGIRSS